MNQQIASDNAVARLQSTDGSAPKGGEGEVVASQATNLYINPAINRNLHGLTVTAPVAAGFAYIKSFRPEIERTLLQGVLSATSIDGLKALFGGEIQDTYMNSLVDTIYGDTNAVSDLKKIAKAELDILASSGINLSDDYELPVLFSDAYVAHHGYACDHRTLYLDFTQRLIQGDFRNMVDGITWLARLAGCQRIVAFHTYQVLVGLEPSQTDQYILARQVN